MYPRSSWRGGQGTSMIEEYGQTDLTFWLLKGTWGDKMSPASPGGNWSHKKDAQHRRTFLQTHAESV